MERLREMLGYNGIITSHNNNRSQGYRGGDDQWVRGGGAGEGEDNEEGW